MRLIMLGAPGSGKGTQARRLAEKLDLPAISTGDIFRHELKNDTPLGLKAKGYMEAGDLVPDEVVIDMVAGRLQQDDCSKGFILDGFPRTIPQADGLKGILGKLSIAIDHVVELQIEDDIIIKRLTGRMGCEACGKDFNRFFSPPQTEDVCDACGGKLTSRADDNEETIMNRLTVYKSETAPLIDYYAALIRPIDSGGSPEEGFNRILGAIGA
jgi:adenylate kinase